MNTNKLKLKRRLFVSIEGAEDSPRGQERPWMSVASSPGSLVQGTSLGEESMQFCRMTAVMLCFSGVTDIVVTQ